MSHFNSPFLLGFDQLERVLDRVSKSANDSYPPYNIEQLDVARLRITLAVAGFTRDDLSVTVEDNQLVIRGKSKDDSERNFIHRGIAARQFQRSFILADGIDVTDANLRNGLLSIDLARPEPEIEVRRIEIRDDAENAQDKRPTRTITLAASNKDQ